MARDEVLGIVARSPKLIFKLFFSYLKFKRKAKKAAEIFRKELIRSGVEKETAGMLANEFSKSAEVFNINIRDLTGVF